MLKKFNVYRLSAKFYNDYPQSNYPEMLSKLSRPYNCLVIEHNDYIIAVPYRTEIRHRNAYVFKTSKRARTHNSGLDYSKAVIIKDNAYIDPSQCAIDGDEYNETAKNIKTIAREVTDYIAAYVEHHKGTRKLDKSKYNRSYRYCTLKYFHNELGI